MDVISVIASIISILTGAGQSCSFIIRKLNEIQDKDLEVRHASSAVQAVQKNIAQISSFLVHHKDTTQGRPTFLALEQLLKAFADEMVQAEKLVEKAVAGAAGSKSQRILSRLQWNVHLKASLASTLRRISNWQSVLTCTLAILQLAHKISEREATAEATDLIAELKSASYVHMIQPQSPDSIEPSKIVGTSSRVKAPDEGLQLDAFEKPLFNILPRVIRFYFEPIAIQAHFHRRMSCYIAVIEILSGPVVAERLGTQEFLTHTTLDAGNSFGIILRLRTQNLLSFQASLKIYVTQKPADERCWCLYHSMSYCAIIPSNSAAVRTVRQGDIRKLRRLFEARDIRPSDLLQNGMGLLHIALLSEQSGMVEFLVEVGADINIADTYGDTPLHLALRQQLRYDVVQLLLRNGASIGSVNRQGQTPLHTFFYEAVGRLLRANIEIVDTSLLDSRGMSIAHYTAWSKTSTFEAVKHLLSDPCQPFQMRDRHGRTVLHFAAQRGNISLIQALLATDRDWSVESMKDNLGCTPLHYAVESPRSEVIDLLIGVGFSLDSKDGKGRTVLQRGAMAGTAKAFQYILARLSESELQRDALRKEAAIFAQEHGNLRVLECLPNAELEAESHEDGVQPSQTALESRRFGEVAIALVLMVLCFWYSTTTMGKNNGEVDNRRNDLGYVA